MDLSKATKQQIYEIATNESNRLKDRYVAVKELQKRKAKDKND
ncbi:hypothetical protein V7152_14880 [Neobacillus drentensis]